MSQLEKDYMQVYETLFLNYKPIDNNILDIEVTLIDLWY